MTVVVVGAGLAGLRAAEAIAAHGHAVTIIGDEVHPPYNRPPLSKEALRGGVVPEELAFRVRHADLDWHLGQPATGLDLPGRRVLLDDDAVDFEALVIATGIRPRQLPVPGPAPRVLRTLEDAAHLRAALAPGRRLLIVGAGFIGCEVAATARSLGCEVTVCAADAEPMIRPLGAELGAGLRRRHERAGVVFHLGTAVSRYEADGACLADGRTLIADTVVSAVGSLPNTEWCAGADLDLSDGVLTDSTLCAVRPGHDGPAVRPGHDGPAVRPGHDGPGAGSAAPVLAVGDIARFPNLRFDDVPRRVEHWSMPTDTGRHAGAVIGDLLAGRAPGADFRPLPSFWSDQYDATIQSFGMPGLGEATLVSGTWDGDCIVEYHREDTLVGVVGVNRTRDLAAYRRAIGRPEAD